MSKNFEPLPDEIGRLMGLTEACCNQIGTAGVVAVAKLDKDGQHEIVETIIQNVNTIRTAAKGVSASQRALVYAALLRGALEQWRVEGFDAVEGGP